MSLMTVNVLLAGLAGLAALWVAVIYFRTYKEIKSTFTLALLLFAVFFVFHNGVVVYHYISMMTAIGGGERLMLIEGILQLAAIGALLWAARR